MKSKRLSHRTIRIYLIVLISIFIITIPIHYFIIQRLWIDDIDESMIYQKEHLIDGIEKNDLTNSQIDNYNLFSGFVDNTIVIKQINHVVNRADSIYYFSVYDSIRNHVEPYRVLESYAVINNKPYHITINRDLVENEDLFLSILGTQASILIVLIIIILMISIYYFRKTFKPFFLITERLKTIKLDRKTKIDIDCHNIFEFENLKASVETLINHNYNLFLAQKEFVENASHEIQTPLAVIKSQIDLMLDSPSIDQSQMIKIDNIDRQIRYLSSINKNLLLLTKIDNNQFPINETVNVSELLSGYYDHIKEELELIGKKIILNCDNVELDNTNSILLMSLFNNLINNAIKYSTSFSTISVDVTRQKMIVRNSGKSQELSKEHIFDRFYKESDKSKGAGIGLSIVADICKALNHDIDYKFEAPNYHVFVIKFNIP